MKAKIEIEVPDGFSESDIWGVNCAWSGDPVWSLVDAPLAMGERALITAAAEAFVADVVVDAEKWRSFVAPNPMSDAYDAGIQLNVVERILAYSGKSRKQVGAPHLTAREAIALADWIVDAMGQRKGIFA